MEIKTYLTFSVVLHGSKHNRLLLLVEISAHQFNTFGAYVFWTTNTFYFAVFLLLDFFGCCLMVVWAKHWAFCICVLSHSAGFSINNFVIHSYTKHHLHLVVFFIWQNTLHIKTDRLIRFLFCFCCVIVCYFVARWMLINPNKN